VLLVVERGVNAEQSNNLDVLLLLQLLSMAIERAAMAELHRAHFLTGCLLLYLLSPAFACSRRWPEHG